MYKEFKEKLKQNLTENGAALIGFCELPKSEQMGEFTHAVSIAYKLSDTVLKTIENEPSIMYFHHYRTVNTKLDLLALSVVSAIEEQGFLALPIAASQSLNTNKNEYCGVFSHKTAARLSGLGFIGKNGLLITKEYGSKIRLCTVLTNMPLKADRNIVLEDCGECEICKNLCPAKAIYGTNFSLERGRDSVLDAKKCSLHMKKAYMHIGRGSVCGLCIKNCPKNKL